MNHTLKSTCALLVATGATLALAAACDVAPPRAERTADARSALCDGDDSYIDENGEEVICIYTDEPGYPPDPCFLFPEFCYPPDPPDPCEANPDACSPPDPAGGGPDPLPTCESTISEIPADFQQQVNQRVESCFDTNWSNTAFVERTDATNYSPGSGGYGYNIIDWINNNVTSCVIQNFDWAFYGGSVGGQTMTNLVDRLNQQAQAENLTPHQKICSAMCVSAKLITYADGNFANMLPSNAVGNGYGVCREFAQIGERLLDGMGFTSSTVGSSATRHAFVEVTSPEGGSFYVEPQPSECVFYNRH